MVRKAAFWLIVAGIVSAIAGALLGLTAQLGQVRAASNFQTRVKPAEGDTRGRISFPGRGKSYFVLEGSSVANLLQGPVHVTDSGIPGEPGNSIIAAHRDTQFRVLKQLHKGEKIEIEERGRVFQYRITELEVIEPDDDRYYQPTSRAVLTLVTCYPFAYIGPAPQRYVVRAELVGIAG
jgi:sortase A